MKYREINEEDLIGSVDKRELPYINWAFKRNNIILKEDTKIYGIFNSGGIIVSRGIGTTTIYNCFEHILKNKLYNKIEDYEYYIELEEVEKKIKVFKLPKEVK